MARLPDEGESHGSFRHGKLAVLVPGRGPAELPELLGDGEQQSHGHQAGGQRGQGRDQVKGVEHHPRVEVSNGSLWGGEGDGATLSGFSVWTSSRKSAVSFWNE